MVGPRNVGDAEARKVRDVPSGWNMAHEIIYNVINFQYTAAKSKKYNH